MFRLLTLFCVLATTMAAPAPKPVVVYPPYYNSPVYHPPVYHAPVVHPAPVAVSHLSTLLSHPPVLPYRTVLPAALPPSPYVSTVF